MNRLSDAPSALVIGGGIVGLCSALAFARRGWRVTVLEREAMARQSSWAGGGLLSPLYPWRQPDALWQLAREGMAHYPALCDELRRETGVDPEWTASGLDLLDEGEFAAGLAWCSRQGLVAEPRALDGGWPAPRPVLHLPWVAQVRNPRLCRALALRLAQLGARLVEQAGEVRLQRDGPQAVAESAGHRWSADVLVAAAGAWTASLLQGIGWPVPIVPVKGQMLLLKGPPQALPGLLLHEGRYLIPRRDGHVLVGSTVEERGFDRAPDTLARESLQAFAETTWPACARMSLVGHWAGLRPGSPEGIPWLQRHPELQNLWVNSGHHRYGLTMAPASAERLLAGVSPSRVS